MYLNIFSFKHILNLGCVVFFDLGALCKSGWFGKYCDQKCSSHCNVSNDCYQGNGTCKGGCADGWMSDRCDQGKTDETLKLVDRYNLLT